MTVVLVVAALIAVIAYEVRADRKVRRSTAGATPVVIVRGLKPRWWRRLIADALGAVLPLAILAGLLLAAIRLHDTSGDNGPVQYRPTPTGTGTASPSGKPSPSHGRPAASTSHSSTPAKGHTP